MATVILDVDISSLRLFTSVQPPELLLEIGTGGVAPNVADAFPVLSYAFDATTLEAAYIDMFCPNYGSGNMTVRFDWYATAVTGAVAWSARISARTAFDAQSILTEALATAGSTATTVNTTASGPNGTSVTILAANLDGLAANDRFTLKVYRDAAAGGDTMAGDAKLYGLTVFYSDV